MLSAYAQQIEWLKHFSVQCRSRNLFYENLLLQNDTGNMMASARMARQLNGWLKLFFLALKSNKATSAAFKHK